MEIKGALALSREYFEKYGKVKSNRPLKNGQECYLLVVLTKKPYVRGFWECDIHEIKGV